jgi:hypothetical protein
MQRRAFSDSTRLVREIDAKRRKESRPEACRRRRDADADIIIIIRRQVYNFTVNVAIN